MQKKEIIAKLSEVVIELYNETMNYETNPTDVQLWYNRGYANGVAAALRENDQSEALEGFLSLDKENLYTFDRVMEWHKAYHHGYEMGRNESVDVLSE